MDSVERVVRSRAGERGRKEIQQRERERERQDFFLRSLLFFLFRFFRLQGDLRPASALSPLARLDLVQEDGWALNIPSITLFGSTPGYRNTVITDVNKIIESKIVYSMAR